jgi:hypothetical protein
VKSFKQKHHQQAKQGYQPMYPAVIRFYEIAPEDSGVRKI